MTKIEWTDQTWNPLTGCTKVSPGCANCYAETLARRLKAMGKPQYQNAVNGNGKWTGQITLVPDKLKDPLSWRKPRRVFVNSMSDLFHENVPGEYIERVFAVMESSPRHIYQILTKRPERMLEFCNHPSGKHLPAHNVWLGVSVENQKAADERIPYLLQTPAAVRFLSCEPLLGPVALDHGNYGSSGFWIDKLGWVIVGCESGPKRRTYDLEWVRSLVQQCQSAFVPVFVKQLLIDGKVSHNPQEWPEDLRIREWPR